MCQLSKWRAWCVRGCCVSRMLGVVVWAMCWELWCVSGVVRVVV